MYMSNDSFNSSFGEEERAVTPTFNMNGHLGIEDSTQTKTNIEPKKSSRGK